jgi:hypothetical protein
MKSVILTVALGLIAAPVLSQTTSSGAHFMSAEGSVGSNGALTVAFDEAGLGNASGVVSISLAADATGTYACINGGGNHPKATNKTTVSSPIFATADFPVRKNGRVSGSISGGPPDEGSFACPTGQDLRLACVAYTNVVLTDVNNSVSVTPTGSFTRTFITIAGYCT